MTRVKLLPLGLLCCLLFALTAPLWVMFPTASAPSAGLASGTTRRAPLDYDFQILNETVHVYPQMDASVFINYSITFRNFGTDFDYIDIGFPNSYYELGSIEAYWSLENASFVELTSIAPSSFISIGVEIFVPPELRPGNGEEGTLLVWGNQPIMVYLDTVHTGYVGYEFVPTFFDPAYCRSTDYLAMHLHFPDTFFNGTLAYYHHDPPTDYYYSPDSLVYVWIYGPHIPQAYLQGISFPYDESYITTYYTTNGGTTFDFWAFFEEYGELIIVGVVVLVFISCCVIGAVQSSRRGGGVRIGKTGYLPPAVKVEALGVRRGLTVVEAAVLNEVPLQRVFTMIVFGLLKKNLIRLERAEKGRPTFHPNADAIAKASTEKGILHYYERLFLKAIQANGTLSKPAIRTTLNTLIKTTARKLEGYSRPDTKAFYTRMIDTAWRTMDQATTASAQANALNDYAEWLLLTPDYDTRIRHYDTYYVPTWYWFWIWSAHPRPHTITGPHPTPTTPPLTPITLTNFANATVLGTQHFANTVVTGFQTLANQIATAFRPPPPPPPRSSFSGRSCACACACVSCACACAGGGR